eukprot:Rmarinus@m.3243
MDIDAFSSFQQGRSAVKTRACEALDNIEDSVRFFAEECDQFSGIHCFFDADTAWGGVASEVAEMCVDAYRRPVMAAALGGPLVPGDELPSTPAEAASLPYEERTRRQRAFDLRALNTALAASAVAPFSACYIPVDVRAWAGVSTLPFRVSPKSMYETSAVVALGLQGFMSSWLHCRDPSSSKPGFTMLDASATLARRGTTCLADISVGCVSPPGPGQTIQDTSQSLLLPSVRTCAPYSGSGASSTRTALWSHVTSLRAAAARMPAMFTQECPWRNHSFAEVAVDLLGDGAYGGVGIVSPKAVSLALTYPKDVIRPQAQFSYDDHCEVDVLTRASGTRHMAEWLRSLHSSVFSPHAIALLRDHEAGDAEAVQTQKGLDEWLRCRVEDYDPPEDSHS